MFNEWEVEIRRFHKLLLRTPVCLGFAPWAVKSGEKFIKALRDYVNFFLYSLYLFIRTPVFLKQKYIPLSSLLTCFDVNLYDNITFSFILNTSDKMYFLYITFV